MRQSLGRAVWYHGIPWYLVFRGLAFRDGLLRVSSLVCREPWKYPSSSGFCYVAAKLLRVRKAMQYKGFAVSICAVEPGNEEIRREHRNVAQQLNFCDILRHFPTLGWHG